MNELNKEEIFEKCLIKAGRTDYYMPNLKDVNENIEVNKNFVLNNFARDFGNALIDYISDNIDADFEIIRNKQLGAINLDSIEVYCPKSQFEEFKKLIK